MDGCQRQGERIEKERGRQSSLERHTMTEADAFGNHWGHGFDLVIFACKFLSCGATNKT